MRTLTRHIAYLLSVAMILLVSCSSYDDVVLDLEPAVESDEVVSGDDSSLSKGFSSFYFDLPLLDRFQTFVDEYGDTEVDVEIYMRGRTVTDEYTLSATMYADRDSIFVNAVDLALLAELYHQEYFVNYMIVTGATRSSEEEIYPDGAMVIGALLSATDPDDVYFVSTFTTSSSVSGSGTQFDPYIIASATDFETEIADKMNSGEDLSGNYYLQSDNLNFSGSSIGRVGASNSTYFAGHYDGGMMIISQLTLSDTSDVALFYGLASSGVFCNTIFESVTITGNSSSGEYCGVIAAHCAGGTISNVFIESGCKVSAWKYAGGLIGSGFAKIYKSTCRANVSGYAAIGGFVGGMLNHASSDLSFYDCVYSGTTTASDHCAGGLIGYISEANDISVEYCYISGTVYADLQYTGGAIGLIEKFSDCTVEHLYLGESRSTDYDTYINGSAYESALILNNNSDTSDSSMWYVGGIIGHAVGKGTSSSTISISNSYFKGSADVTAKHCIGGAVGYAKDLHFSGRYFYNYVNLTSNISSSSSSESYIGGAIGFCSNVYFSGGNTFYNYGDITSTERYVGGLIGYYETASTGTQSLYLYLYNYGNVSGSSDNVGGCIGSFVNSVSNSSYYQIEYNNYGCVSGNDNVGGFVGVVNGNPSTLTSTGSNHSGSSSSSYNVVISGSDYVGGLIGKLHTDSTTPSTLDIYGSTVADVNGSALYTGGLIGGISNDVTNLSCTLSFKDKGSSVLVVGGDYTGGIIGGANVQGSTLASLTISSSESNLASTSSVAGGKYTGGFVGGMYSITSFSMSTCSNVAAVSGSTNVGGLLGGVDTSQTCNVSISGSYNDGAVSASSTGVAGIIGFYRTKKNDLSVSQSCNTGKISTSVSDKAYIGGILGDAEWTDEDDVGNIDISECYNSGSIEGSGHRGGLVGRTASHASIASCFNMGAVVSGGTCVAGLVGSADHEGSGTKITFKYCYNTGVSGYGILGGEDGMDHNDCSYTNVYYLISASGDDIKLSNKDEYNATGYTESQMAGGSMLLDPTTYYDPSYMWATGELPYLWNIKHYISYPKVSL